MRYKETQMKKILIYGTGMVADYFIDNHDFAGEELVGVIETVKSREAFRGFSMIRNKSTLSEERASTR